MPATLVFIDLTTITPDDTFEAVLEPLDGLGLVDTVACANLAFTSSALGDTLAWSSPTVKSVCEVLDISFLSELREHSHATIKVHSIDSNRRIILDTQVDVL